MEAFKIADNVWGVFLLFFIEISHQKMGIKYILVYNSTFDFILHHTWIFLDAIFGDMQFSMLNDSTLFLLDTAWTKESNGTTFTKSSTLPDAGIEQRLNNCLVTGTYSIYVNGKKQSGRVDILPNGQINGLHPKIGYKICYAGDCLEDTIYQGFPLRFGQIVFGGEFVGDLGCGGHEVAPRSN